MTDDPTTIELEVEGRTFRSGTTTGRKLVPVVAEGDGEEWLSLAQRVISKLRTGEGIKHRLDDEGDRLTLGELLDRNGLTMADLEDERRLGELDVLEDLSVGDIVEVTRLCNGEPQDPQRGVVRDQFEGDDFFSAKAEIDWGDHTWSKIENDEGTVRIGRATMMGQVYDVEVVDPADVTDQSLLETRERVLESAALDESVDGANLKVVDEETWTEDRDQHGTITVDVHESGGSRAAHENALRSRDGEVLDEPVTVKMANIFDGGWVATVRGDVDADTEALLVRFARRNSPISTGVRL